MDKSKRKLAIEAIQDSIISGLELDYDIGTNNYGYAVFTIWLENGDSLTVTNDEFLELKKEAWRKIKLI